MTKTEEIVDLEDVTTSMTESINPTKVEEETSTTTQVEMGQSSENPNGNAKPNPKKTHRT
jgi:hypothetical protein